MFPFLRQHYQLIGKNSSDLKLGETRGAKRAQKFENFDEAAQVPRQVEDVVRCTIGMLNVLVQYKLELHEVELVWVDVP